MQKALVSVMGADKTGIIAKVSHSLYDQNINILEISQTILDGYFTMLMIVDISKSANSFAEIADRLRLVGDETGVSVNLQRADLYDAMHRV